MNRELQQSLNEDQLNKLRELVPELRKIITLLHSGVDVQLTCLLDHIEGKPIPGAGVQLKFGTEKEITFAPVQPSTPTQEDVVRVLGQVRFEERLPPRIRSRVRQIMQDLGLIKSLPELGGKGWCGYR